MSRLRIWIEHGHLRIETYTGCARIGIWLYPWFSTYLEFKWVGWYFYSKARFGFGFLGVEYINHCRSTRWENRVRSLVLSRETSRCIR